MRIKKKNKSKENPELKRKSEKHKYEEIPEPKKKKKIAKRIIKRTKMFN